MNFVNYEMADERIVISNILTLYNLLNIFNVKNHHILSQDMFACTAFDRKLFIKPFQQTLFRNYILSHSIYKKNVSRFAIMKYL